MLYVARSLRSPAEREMGQHAYIGAGDVAAKRRRTKISNVLNVKAVPCCFNLERVRPLKSKHSG